LLNWYETAILAISAVSALSALLAVCLAWRGLRLSNTTVVKIDEVRASFTQCLGENNEEPFGQLTVLIRNKGLALHSMTAALTLKDLERFGQFRIELRRRDAPSEPGVFAKGMVAEMGLKGYELDDMTRSVLGGVTSPHEHDASICVYSQGYLTAKFKLYGRLDSLKMKWNGLAFKFNRLFDRQVGRNEQGTPVVKTYTILPTFEVWSFQLESFLRFLQAPRQAASQDVRGSDQSGKTA